MGLISQALTMQMGGSSNIQGLLQIYKNGVYIPGNTTGGDYYDKDADGVYQIEVMVPIPEYKSDSIIISENNVTMKASEQGLDGFDEVTVNVPTGGIIKPLTVRKNGTYIAADYGWDGFDPVNVDNFYEKLYKIEHPDEEDIEHPTGQDDPDGNEIIIIGKDIGDDPKAADNYTIPQGNFATETVTIPKNDGSKLYVLNCSYNYHKVNGHWKVDITVTNVTDGISKTYYNNFVTPSEYDTQPPNLQSSYFVQTTTGITYSYVNSVYGMSAGNIITIRYADIGINYTQINPQNIKYYIT